MGGYIGKILRINLSTRKTTELETKDYREWGGGHGFGSKIFYDIMIEENGIDLESIDGFSPENIVTIMTSPLCGTGVPAASGRTEVQGLGLQPYPVGWFTRSNFGGRFSAMLKYAGWDGIVIEGAASSPVWVDIRNDKVKIQQCSDLDLWGQDAWESQQTILDYVAGENGKYGDWIQQGSKKGSKKSSGQTTQRPAVLAIGRAGEAKSRLACLIHDAGNAAGQGGFGGVFGAKNLKAISVIGTGSIPVSDPKALIAARIWQVKNYGFDMSKVEGTSGICKFYFPPIPLELGDTLTSMDDLIAAATEEPGESTVVGRKEGKRPKACIGCHSGCRARYKSGIGNEACCQASAVLTMGNIEATTDDEHKTSDLVNRYGVNSFEFMIGLMYLKALYSEDVLGPGKEIDCDLDFSSPNVLELVEELLERICAGNDEFGKTIAQGFMRAAEKWGRIEEDLQSGRLRCPHWGFPEHYDPRAQVEWGYGSILGDRDINEHGVNSFFWDALTAFGSPEIPAEQAVRIFSEKMIPYHEDQDAMLMLDYSDENMYSQHIAKLVAWHRHYTRYWKQAMLFCDHRWPDMINIRTPDKKGSTPEAEPKFVNAVIGGDISFADGMEIGRKIWNLDHAIWTLQGRKSPMVQFAPYIYEKEYEGFAPPLLSVYFMPGLSDGSFAYLNVAGRKIDREKFEEFKKHFYRIEGWDPSTGYPKRSTLSALGLEQVSDKLSEIDRLGKEEDRD